MSIYTTAVMLRVVLYSLAVQHFMNSVRTLSHTIVKTDFKICMWRIFHQHTFCMFGIHGHLKGNKYYLNKLVKNKMSWVGEKIIIFKYIICGVLAHVKYTKFWRS